MQIGVALSSMVIIMCMAGTRRGRPIFFPDSLGDIAFVSSLSSNFRAGLSFSGLFEWAKREQAVVVAIGHAVRVQLQKIKNPLS